MVEISTVHIAQPKHLVQVKEDNLDEVMGPDNAMC